MECWVARDKTGDLYIYDGKPSYPDPDCTGIFGCRHVKVMDQLDSRLFPEIVFENSPVKFTTSFPE